MMLSFVAYLYSHVPQLASAVTLTAVLNPNQNSTQVTYEELHTVLINYPQNSEIATLFKDNAGEISITATSLPTENNKVNLAAMQKLVTYINQALSNTHSLVRVTAVNMKFIGDIRGYSSTQSNIAQRGNTHRLTKSSPSVSFFDPT